MRVFEREMNQRGPRLQRGVCGIAWLLAVMLMIGGCANEVQGPQPELEDPVLGEPLPVDPGIVCRMQHPDEGTSVVVTGENLSPIPFDIPGEPNVGLPDLTLRRTLTIDGQAADPLEIEFSGEIGDPNADLVTWQSQNQMTFLLKDEIQLDAENAGMLEEGIYDLTVTNQNSNGDTSAGALAVIDRPFVSNLSPSIVCVDEGSRNMTVFGDRMLRIGQEDATVLIDGLPFTVGQFSGCTKVAHSGIEAEYCTSADISIAQDDLEDGYLEVLVQNPQTAACQSVHAEDSVSLRVVPKPDLASIAPPMVCVAEGAREVVLKGQGFLEIDEVVPEVTVASKPVTVTGVQGECSELETRDHQVKTCSDVLVELPQDASITQVTVPTVSLTNPPDAGCGDSTQVDLVIVPPPTVEKVVPPLVCIDQGDRQVEVVGTGFLFVDGTPPAVQVGSVTIPPTAVAKPAEPEKCQALAVVGLDVVRCTSVLVTIAQGTVDVGLVDIGVVNPAPAGCGAVGTGQLTIIEGPELTSAEPALVCTDTAARDIEITGAGFLVITNDDSTQALPAVTIDGATATVKEVPTASCSPVVVAGMTVDACTSIVVSVGQGSLTPGDKSVVVTNPIPAGCEATSDTILTVPPSLALLSATPPSICEWRDQSQSGDQRLYDQLFHHLRGGRPAFGDIGESHQCVRVRAQYGADRYRHQLCHSGPGICRQMGGGHCLGGFGHPDYRHVHKRFPPGGHL